MKVAIIKYNAGNIRSVSFALGRLGVDHVITSDAAEIRKADKVIFPGVGEASSTMKYLKEHKLDELIVSLKQPVLGICLGMQLMCSYSEEGDVACLGIFNEKVKKFVVPNPNPDLIKVPHMGWNAITNVNSPLFDLGLENKFVYFVHSYYVALGGETAATTHYIHPFSSALHKDNFYATQFHPEKSGDVGSRILENFIKL
jgi:glutamine amidotransferase